jgi:hypothetical protein
VFPVLEYAAIRVRNLSIRSLCEQLIEGIDLSHGLQSHIARAAAVCCLRGATRRLRLAGAKLRRVQEFLAEADSALLGQRRIGVFVRIWRRITSGVRTNTSLRNTPYHHHRHHHHRKGKVRTHVHQSAHFQKRVAALRGAGRPHLAGQGAQRPRRHIRALVH